MGLNGILEKSGISRALMPGKLGCILGGADLRSLRLVCKLNSNKKIAQQRRVVLPLNTKLLEDLYGEPGEGKLGIGLDLNVTLASVSIGSFLLSIAPLRSVFRLKPIG